MDKETTIQQSTCDWPIFGYRSKQKVKKFWDRDKNPLTLTESFVIEGQLMRVGKKKQKPKLYYFRLDTLDNLFYFKKETDFIPKGKIKLDEYIQINLKQISIKDGSKKIAIQLLKTQDTYYKLYHKEGVPIFDWWSILIQICTINNFEEMYHPIEQLGKGSFAIVYKVKRLIDSKIFAAKYYYKEAYETNQNKEKFAQMIKNERKVLKNVQHPGIIQIHECYQQPDKIVLIMDFVPGRDLYHLIKENKRISEKKASIIVLNLADALNTLTKAGYVHRDIKLENILICNKITLQTKIVDFGFAEQINRTELTGKAGTPGYIAPEVFANLPYLEKGDVFSLGVISFCLVGGYSPFRGKTYQKIMEENRLAQIRFDNSQIWKEVSPECIEIIQQMTNPNQSLRISFDDIIKHKWISNEFNKAKLSLIDIKNIDLSVKDSGSFEIKSLGDGPQSFYTKSNPAFFSKSSVDPNKILNIQENVDNLKKNIKEVQYLNKNQDEEKKIEIILKNSHSSSENGLNDQQDEKNQILLEVYSQEYVIQIDQLNKDELIQIKSKNIQGFQNMSEILSQPKFLVGITHALNFLDHK